MSRIEFHPTFKRLEIAYFLLGNRFVLGNKK